MKVDVADVAQEEGVDGLAERLIETATPLAGSGAPVEPARPARSGPARLRLITIEELRKLPDVPYLVEPVLPARALAVVYGAPKTGKSFVALDLALCVATGRDFLDHPTAQGQVVYIAAEGSAGLGKRVVAWELRRRSVEEHFFVLPQAVRPGSPDDLEELRRCLRDSRLEPALIVVDTLARCIIPGDENSNKDMSAFVEGLGELQREFGSAVLVVHHSGHDGSRERGASALRGAVDTLIGVRRVEGDIEVSCEAQKDDEPFASFYLRLVPVDLPGGRSSCVVERVEAPTRLPEASRSDRERELLRAMSESVTVQRKDLLLSTSVPESSLTRMLDDLVRRGLVSKAGRGEYLRTASGTHYLGAAGSGVGSRERSLFDDTVDDPPGVEAIRTDEVGDPPAHPDPGAWADGRMAASAVPPARGNEEESAVDPPAHPDPGAWADGRTDPVDAPVKQAEAGVVPAERSDVETQPGGDGP